MQLAEMEMNIRNKIKDKLDMRIREDAMFTICAMLLIAGGIFGGYGPGAIVFSMLSIFLLNRCSGRMSTAAESPRNVIYAAMATAPALALSEMIVKRFIHASDSYPKGKWTLFMEMTMGILVCGNTISLCMKKNWVVDTRIWIMLLSMGSISYGTFYCIHKYACCWLNWKVMGEVVWRCNDYRREKFDITGFESVDPTTLTDAIKEHLAPVLMVLGKDWEFFNSVCVLKDVSEGYVRQDCIGRRIFISSADLFKKPSPYFTRRVLTAMAILRNGCFKSDILLRSVLLPIGALGFAYVCMYLDWVCRMGFRALEDKGKEKLRTRMFSRRLVVYYIAAFVVALVLVVIFNKIFYEWQRYKIREFVDPKLEHYKRYAGTRSAVKEN